MGGCAHPDPGLAVASTSVLAFSFEIPQIRTLGHALCLNKYENIDGIWLKIQCTEIPEDLVEIHKDLLQFVSDICPCKDQALNLNIGEILL